MSAKCRFCGQDLMVPDGQLRVHFAKPADQRPCAGSWPEKPTGREAAHGEQVLIGPDPDGQGGSFGVTMGDKVMLVATNEVGDLTRRRVGSKSDDRVTVKIGNRFVDAKAHEIVPWKGN